MKQHRSLCMSLPSADYQLSMDLLGRNTACCSSEENGTESRNHGQCLHVLFICVDESGSDSKVQLRKYSYALRGERAVCRRLHVYGKCVSAIAAISTEGLELTDGSVNGDIFFDFVRGSLIPEMNSFDGCSPISIAVMDNCSIHHTEDVDKLFQNAAILLMYLPPYSPDTNPIELAFGYIKAHLKVYWATCT